MYSCIVFPLVLFVVAAWVCKLLMLTHRGETFDAFEERAYKKHGETGPVISFASSAA